MSLFDKKGISLAAGFDYQAKDPLDSRLISPTIADMNKLITENAVYPNLKTFCLEDNTEYYYDEDSNTFVKSDAKTDSNYQDLLSKITAETKRATSAESTLSARVDTKYDKTGGTISGSTNITGTLTVGATTFSTVSYADVLGDSKSILQIDGQLYARNGIVFGGTASAAGLVTRGICGIGTPSESDGSLSQVTKDSLYLNYDDGDNSYSRKVILGAGSLGSDLGSGIYSYTAVRGDQLASYVTNVASEINNDISALSSNLNAHTSNTSNPHSVTKAQVGLGNVVNAGQTASVTQSSNLYFTTGGAYNLQQSLLSSITNAHTSQQLSNVDLNDYTSAQYKFYWASGGNNCTNKPADTDAFGMLSFRTASGYYCQLLVGANQKQNTLFIRTSANDTWTGWVEYSKVGHTHSISNITNLQTTLDTLSSNIDAEVSRATAAESTISSTLASHTSNTSNPHNVTKLQIGLGNVDNTSDIDKPVSTATQSVLDTKVDKEDGKGLSTNDFTNTYKSQLDSLSTVYATKTDISNLIDGAPETFDTLKEIADYLTAHAEEAAGIVSDIANLTTSVTNLTSTVNTISTNLTSTMSGLTSLSGVVSTISSIVNANNFPKNAKVLSGIDLNTLSTSSSCGFYYAGGSHNCENCPLDINQGFGLLVLRVASGYFSQIYIQADTNATNNGTIWLRNFGNGGWSEWYKIAQDRDIANFATTAALSAETSRATTAEKTLQNDINLKANVFFPTTAQGSATGTFNANDLATLKKCNAVYWGAPDGFSNGSQGVYIRYSDYDTADPIIFKLVRDNDSGHDGVTCYTLQVNTTTGGYTIGRASAAGGIRIIDNAIKLVSGDFVCSGGSISIADLKAALKIPDIDQPFIFEDLGELK